MLDKAKNPDEQWIRHIWYSPNGQHFMIFVCTLEEAKEFQFCEHLQVDKAFKMVQGQTNVWSLVGWSNKSNRMLCTSRACFRYMLI